MDNVARLLAACNAVVADPALRPEYTADGGTLLKTYCNLGAQLVAKAMGCAELDLPDVQENADFLFQLMERGGSGSWTKVDGAGAAKCALGGLLAYAVLPSFHLGEKHGHIAAVRPEPMRMSASAGGMVPVVANVGRGDPTVALTPLGRGGLLTRPNWNCRVSDAFPVKRVGLPYYFVWRPQ